MRDSLIRRAATLVAAVALLVGGTVAVTAGPAAAASCGTPSYCYEYNGFGQDFTSDPATGTCVTTTIGKPYVDNTTLAAAHSLGQGAIESQDTGDNIEFGWIVDKAQRADGNPFLFATHKINGVFKGYQTAWVDNAANPVNLGAGLPKPANKSFCIGQTSTTFTVSYDGTLVATMAKSRWTPGGVVRPFNAATADVYLVKWFNETVSHETETCSDMGTGTLWNATGTPTPPVTTWSGFSVTGTAISPNWFAAWGDPGTTGVHGATATSGTGGVTGGPGHDVTGGTGGSTGIC